MDGYTDQPDPVQHKGYTRDQTVSVASFTISGWNNSSKNNAVKYAHNRTAAKNVIQTTTVPAIQYPPSRIGLVIIEYVISKNQGQHPYAIRSGN